MIIFLEEILLQLFLWMLKIVDGIIDVFNAIAGATNVLYHGSEVNIIEYLLSDSIVSTIAWCVLILAVGLTCIFLIVALIKNMLDANRDVKSILYKFFLAILGTVAMFLVVIIGILISNSILTLLLHMFTVNGNLKLSTILFNACVGEWQYGYSIAEINLDEVSVRDLFGEYYGTFTVFPISWKYNGMVNPDSFLYIPAFISGIGLLGSLLIAIVNLARRVYEIVLLYISLPLSLSTLPLDDGARFRNWRETLISKIVIAYGSIFSINLYALLLPLINSMEIIGASNFSNQLFLIFMVAGGACVIPASQGMFVRIFGSGDPDRIHGGFIRDIVRSVKSAGIATITHSKKVMSESKSHKYKEKK